MPSKARRASQLAEMMVGRKVILSVDKRESRARRRWPCEALTGAERAAAGRRGRRNFEVHGGEVLGIAGGAGQRPDRTGRGADVAAQGRERQDRYSATTSPMPRRGRSSRRAWRTSPRTARSTAWC